MAEKKETYPGGIQSVQQTALQAPPTQESIDLLTRLLREFERRSYPSSPSLPPEVERGIEVVEATFQSLTNALALGPNPIVVSSVSPSYGRASGGESVTILGSRRQIRDQCLVHQWRRDSRDDSRRGSGKR